jgi:hypothetical protein
MREAILILKGTILHKSVQILAHADDVVIVERYENAVKDAFNRLKMEAQKKWFSDYDKEKYVKNGKPKKQKCIRINNLDIEKVNQFKYLGSNIT